MPIVTGTAAAVKDVPIRALEFKELRLYTFVGAFIALDVLVPYVFHQFHLAGATYLPMHIFVLIAGLLFGWRAGLLVGLFTPLISFGASGMPILLLLPQITFELVFYGLAAGILRERLNCRIIWALLGAMAIGRLALVLGVFLLYWGKAIPAPYVSSAVQPDIVSPVSYVLSVIKQGLPGIVMQLILIPPLTRVLEKRFHKNSNE